MNSASDQLRVPSSITLISRALVAGQDLSEMFASEEEDEKYIASC
jgi:hypothetical protein